MPSISVLVEGTLDAAVAEKIITTAGGRFGTVYGRKGVDYIEKKIQGFNDLAQGVPLLTLVDLMDLDSDCPAEIVQDWLPHRHDQMLFRFVVREIESWILADRTSISRFFGLRKALIPHHPEQLEDPKAALVDLARSFQRQGLRNAIVPDDPTMNDEGPAYTIRMQRFVQNQWSVRDAVENAPSLHRCVQVVQRVVDSSGLQE